MEPEQRPAQRGRSETEWGEFTEAIRRWELISGYWSPSPVNDKGHLSPRWVEWMMGFEAGWVTDIIPSRMHALRLLGNSVCPPQAEVALALLT